MKVVVYSREGCECCDKALKVLRARQSRHGFEVEVVDIDSDPELVRRYTTEVPVVAIDGVDRFKGQVNPVLLDRLLAAGDR